MMVKKKLLILAIDRDNDLYERCKIVGPVVGRDENLKAATKMALADPEDPDANVIFQAIKLYDELADKYDVQVVTLTGSKNLGYEADRNITLQLEKILEEFPAKSCILVTDGAQDEEITPIINSRIKIDSVKLVIMKQAKELEKTYVVMLEKLKDPYYSKVLLGIPALVLLLYAISTTFNLGWQPVAVVISLYLLAKILHIDDYVWRVISSFEFSSEKISFLIYLTGFSLLVISLWTGVQRYYSLMGHTTPIKLIAASIKTMLILLPVSLLLFVIGKIIDSVNEKNKIAIVRYGFYGVGIILVNLVLSSIAQWIVNDRPPYVSFAELVNITGISLVMGYVSIYILKSIRKNLIRQLKLENKECITKRGMYLGKVVGVDTRSNKLVVLTPFNTKLTYDIDNVVDVSDRVIVDEV